MNSLLPRREQEMTGCSSPKAMYGNSGGVVKSEGPIDIARVAGSACKEPEVSVRAQDNKPWVVMKEDAAECGALLSGCIGLVALLAALLEPFMPSVTRSVRPPAQHGGIKLG